MKRLALAFLIAAGPAAAEEALESRSLMEGKVTIQVPASFTPMSDEHRKLKYPGANAPALVLTDESSTVNIAIDQKPMAIAPNQIKELEAPMRQQFASAKLNSSGMRSINGNDFLVIDVDVPLTDGTNHNHIAITSLEGRMLIISYNCMLSRDANCGALGNRVIESIRLNAKPAG
jgi:hypothetical protein